MVAKIRAHRFDGYTDTGIADEIEKFRGGDGIGSINTAVAALKAVASALAETDVTLRRELGALGIEWQSEAGGQASQVFADQAGFSRDAKDKLDYSAEMIFAQGEAFNRTRYKLPDAATVRKGAGGFTLGDAALSLIGFETDHVHEVTAAQNARTQAVEALNGYAVQSGENLSSVEPIAQPQGLLLDSTSGGPNAIDLGDSAVDLQPSSGTGDSTKAAHTQGHDLGNGGGPVAHSAAKPHLAVPHDTATPVTASRPASGSPPVSAGSGSTAPAASAPPAPPAPSGGGGGAATGGPPRNPAPLPEPGRPPMGSSPGMQPVGGPPAGSVIGGVLGGATSGSTGVPGPGGTVDDAGRPGGVEGGSGARSDFAGGTGAVTGRGEQELGKGRMVGSGPQAPTVPGEVGRAFTSVPKGGPSAGDLAAAAAAIGAGGGGGATSGERERQGRGFGRTAAGGGRPVGPLPLGELPEEEATVMRNSERLRPQGDNGPAGFMEQAAQRGTEGEEDAEHVRRFGIDDNDLFADQRMASPELIGDGNTDEATG
jgi:hypothetical protein